MSKAIGLDYGAKRIGVAISDESGSVAFPKVTLQNGRNIFEELTALIREEKAEVVVIGESKKPSGEDNAIMEEVRVFAKELETRSGVTVMFEPEFYSSVEARQMAGHSFVDAGAAAIILNSYITRTRP